MAKFIVIAATDGATSGVADTVTGVLYFSAVALMALGLAGLGASLLAGRHVVLSHHRGGPRVVTWAVTYMLLESIAQAVVGKTDPAWLGEEVGIVLIGAVLMTVGVLLARPRAPQRADTRSAERSHRRRLSPDTATLAVTSSGNNRSDPAAQRRPSAADGWGRRRTIA